MRVAGRGLALVIVALVAASAWGQASPSVDDLLRMLRATYPDQADTDPLNPGNIAQQRQLNDKGRADAKVVGEAFKAAGVPIGKSYSSQFYRTVETSRLIGGKEPNTTPDVTEGGLVVSPNENNLDLPRFHRG